MRKQFSKWISLFLAAGMVMTTPASVMAEDVISGSEPVTVTGSSDAGSPTEEAEQTREKGKTEVVAKDASKDGKKEETEPTADETADEAEKEAVSLPSEYTDGTADLSGIDFSSKRLIVGTEDAAVTENDPDVVEALDGMYLIQYATEQEAQNAYQYYTEHADFVEVDTGIKSADNTANSDDEDAPKTDGTEDAAIVTDPMTEEEILYDSQDDYMSKYKQVIEYFDAVKVALTATPALHTTEIFGEPVYTYSYREAVIDGWLVDHDPPYIINTDFIVNKAQFKKGEHIAEYDPNTNELLNGAALEDEMDFDVSEFNRKIVLPDNTRKVLEEISGYLNPEGREKTLIFAVNDAHADRIVDTLREIYRPFGISNDAILKITGKTAGGNKKKILQIIKQFENNQEPNIAVTVDLLTTGVDVPPICNLVFMRKVNSRILFEQMMGRATRPCPEIGKTHFNIFDAVRVYEDLDTTSSMKSVSVNKSMSELLEDLFRPDEANKQPIKDRILAKLQRKNNNLTEEQKYEVSERLGGKTVKAYVKELKSCTEEVFIQRCQQDTDFLLWIDGLKGKRRGHYYSDKEDTLLETTRGYGGTEKPEDYLEAFTAFVNENKDRIEAIRIACTKPSDMTRAQLRALKIELDKASFTENSLNEAASSVKNERIVADIIAHVRQAVLNTPLVNHEDRVRAAFAKLTAAHHFNRMQQDLLEKIKTYMLHESILNVETFEAPAFKSEGGFARFNKKLNGQLVEIIREINTYIYGGAA